MARTKCTARKSTCGYLPPRVAVSFGKTVAEDMLQQPREEDDDFEMEPMEDQPMDKEPEEEPIEIEDSDEEPMEEEDVQER